jgi:hypothetical protein
MLRFSKEGFTHFIANVSFLGTGVLNTDYLGGGLVRLSTSNITIAPPMKITKNGWDTGTDTTYDFLFARPVVGDSIINALQTLSFAWFMGRSPNINYLDSTTYITYTSSGDYLHGYFHSKQLKYGDTLYLVAYYAGGSISYQYDDGETTKTDFVGFGKPSNVVQIVLP